jgi:hypothetical protein
MFTRKSSSEEQPGRTRVSFWVMEAMSGPVEAIGFFASLLFLGGMALSSYCLKTFLAKV